MHQSNKSLPKTSINQQSTKNSAYLESIFELNKFEENKIHAYEIVDKIYNEIDRSETEMLRPKTK